jgi:hypothetical protein
MRDAYRVVLPTDGLSHEQVAIRNEEAHGYRSPHVILRHHADGVTRRRAMMVSIADLPSDPHEGDVPFEAGIQGGPDLIVPDLEGGELIKLTLTLQAFEGQRIGVHSVDVVGRLVPQPPRDVRMAWRKL